MESNEKTCTKCRLSKPLAQFGRYSKAPDGLRWDCKACRREYRSALRSSKGEAALIKERAAHDRNREKRNSYQRERWASDAEYRERWLRRNREWHQANKAAKRASVNEWRAKNPDVLAAQNRKAYLKNPFRHRISMFVAASLRKVGAQKQGRGFEKILGYSVADLKRHLERQFTPGMAWDNYGKVWEVDHILPLSGFTYSSADDPDFRAAWSLTNLRPLSCAENRSKGARRTVLI